MYFQGFVTAQVVPKDTLIVNDNSLESIIRYSARDSIFNDLKKKQVHLYGDAKIQMEEVNMTAGYILVDMNTNEISASYAYDKDSNKVEFPTFTDGSEVVTAHKLRYNTQTKKGFLEELSIKQDEFYFHMGIAKRHPNDEIHLRQGRLTTCDLEEPHYHFQLSKGVVVPNERIVTGPMNLWVKGIPTPFGLPFALLPTNQKERTSG
jgi:lipopolysaccharide assembly outer membrane protein LptD (OstA)